MRETKLPDFDDMMALADKIGDLARRRAVKALEIEAEESEIVREVSNNKDYWMSNKPPSMDYIKATYKFSGYEGELLPLRFELAEITSELDNCNLKFRVYQDMIGVWRTEQSNKRAAITT